MSASILNGADTRWVGTMTRIFIIGTIMAREQVGIKDSRAFAPQEAPVPDFIRKEPPGPDFVPKEPPELPLLAFMAL
ncbi:MAG: hypothetical protein ACLPT6_10035 [Desulfobaccales bacterium]